jgi:translation elongation factor EF-4
MPAFSPQRGITIKLNTARMKYTSKKDGLL